MIRPTHVVVPVKATEEQWSGLARDIVMWARFPRGTGAELHAHLKMLGRNVPDWLATEISDRDHVPPKGDVAVAIYRAMLDASDPELTRKVDAVLIAAKRWRKNMGMIPVPGEGAAMARSQLIEAIDALTSLDAERK